MAELTYVAVWPIHDRTRPPAALIAEASRDVDIMVALAGARITGAPRWDLSTDFDRLVCHVMARPYNPDDDPDLPDGRRTVTAAQRDHIKRLAANGFTARAIADQVQVSLTSARRYAKEVRSWSM